MTAQEALALLGLNGGASPETLKAAFRAAAKAARPDREGGDSERLRRTIEAYRLLQHLQVGRAALAAPDAEPTLSISITEALQGVTRTVRLPNGKTLGLRLPAGLRDGDPVRFAGQGPEGGDLILRVQIAAEAHLKAQGDDLYMTVRVDPRVLRDGGRIEAETPAGSRSVWVPRELPEPRRLRLKGQGLPPRAARMRGHLYLTLEPGEAVEETTARDLLRRFANVWTGGARAARAS